MKKTVLVICSILLFFSLIGLVAALGTGATKVLLRLYLDMPLMSDDFLLLIVVLGFVINLLSKALTTRIEGRTDGGQVPQKVEVTAKVSKYGQDCTQEPTLH